MRYLLTPNVGADDFHDFVTYCIFQKNFTAFQVRDLACYPHKFKKEYSEYLDSEKKLAKLRKVGSDYDMFQRKKQGDNNA